MEIKKITESKKIMTILVIVVLLIIAMVSYTYSFFTVTVTDSDSIVGNAASLGVDLTVTKIAPSNDDGLIPQLDDYITKAVIGRKGNCIDDNGNNVCQVYQITVKNTSAASVSLDGTLELNARDNPNLKWAVISGITEPTLISNINSPSVTNFVREDSYEANETKNYYIVLWISETDEQQFDTGEFTGVVTFKDSSSLYFTWVTTDIDDETAVEDDGEVVAYKISDMVPTKLEGALLILADNDLRYAEALSLTEEDGSILRFNEKFIMFSNLFFVVTEAEYMVFPEAGVYVVADFVNYGLNLTLTLDWTNGRGFPLPAPEVWTETVTANSVTLNTIEGAEYSMDGETWQDSPTFTGLKPGTEYVFGARYKETIDCDASEAGTVTVTTPKLVRVDIVTANSVALDAVEGAEYSKDSVNWQDSPIFTELSPGTEYTFYARYKATTEHGVSEVDTVTVKTPKQDATETPSAADITVVEVTANSITLNTIDGAEYSMDNVNWQDSPTFTGLSVATEYTFYVRYKETATAYASESVSTKISTIKYTVSAPSRLYIAETTATSITLTAISGAEYSIDGVNWQDSPTFTGLEPGTRYTLYARYKETDTKYASDSVSTSNLMRPLVEEITDSWETIAQAVKDGTYATKYKVGNYKPMTLTTGEVVNMQIVAVNADTKTDGSAAAISWLSMDLLNTKHVMNTSGTNANGWKASNMRKWLQNDVYATLPDAVKNNIVTVNKTYYDYTTKSTQTCEDTLWIPSYREVFGGTDYEGSGVLYTNFFQLSSEKKNCNGEAYWWWLRSANINSHLSFDCVDKYGYLDSVFAATNNFGVVLGFCM